MKIPRFPEIAPKTRERLLAPPAGPVSLVIDTDAHNEIDDQFALTWALLSTDKLRVEAVYAAPYSFAHYREPLLRTYALLEGPPPGDAEAIRLLERYGGWVAGLKASGLHPRDIPFVSPAEGMALSHEEILRVYEKLQIDPAGTVFRGADRYLTSLNEPVRSAAAEDLVARARAPRDGPLYVVACGALTNIASALLMAPETIHQLVVIWTAGFPAGVNRPNPSLNLEQDMLASQLLFECGVPLVYLPGFHVGAQLRLSLPEMEAWVCGKGAIGDYLYWLYTNNPLYPQRGITGHFGRSWIIWDLINIAWLLHSDWVPSDLISTPALRDDTTWQRDLPGRPLMREAYEINRDAIFRDFFAKLEKAP